MLVEDLLGGGTGVGFEHFLVCWDLGHLMPLELLFSSLVLDW